MEADLSKAKTRNRCPREGFSASVEVVERGFAFNPKSMRKTARAKRVVWTVPGAAADPLGSARPKIWDAVAFRTLLDRGVSRTGG
jgi:hypothetical protein